MLLYIGGKKNKEKELINVPSISKCSGNPAHINERQFLPYLDNKLLYPQQTVFVGGYTVFTLSIHP